LINPWLERDHVLGAVGRKVLEQRLCLATSHRAFDSQNTATLRFFCLRRWRIGKVGGSGVNTRPIDLEITPGNVDVEVVGVAVLVLEAELVAAPVLDGLLPVVVVERAQQVGRVLVALLGNRACEVAFFIVDVVRHLLFLELLDALEDDGLFRIVVADALLDSRDDAVWERGTNNDSVGLGYGLCNHILPPRGGRLRERRSECELTLGKGLEDRSQVVLDLGRGTGKGNEWVVRVLELGAVEQTE